MPLGKSAGPGHRQDNSEDQCIGGDIQIKVREAMHQNCRNTSNATQRHGFVEMLFRVPIVPDGLGEYPEDRTEH